MIPFDASPSLNRKKKVNRKSESGTDIFDVRQNLQRRFYRKTILDVFKTYLTRLFKMSSKNGGKGKDLELKLIFSLFNSCDLPNGTKNEQITFSWIPKPKTPILSKYIREIILTP